jgi:xanthine dehydrogenase accessory factor
MSVSALISNAEAPGPLDWVGVAHGIVSKNERCVLVFVADHKGSTPREKGTWALVGEHQCLGTLGGGEVERTAIAEAQDLLAGRREWRRSTEKFQLGPDLGQCCGGAMVALYEPVDKHALAWLSEAASVAKQGYILFAVSEPGTPPRVMSGEVPENLNETTGVHIQPLSDDRPLVVLYGGGHVGRALAAVAAQLPIRLEIVDERKEALSEIPKAGNITTVHRDNPPSHAKELKGADAVLIMTHSHGLDYRLCQMLLGKADLAYLGLIGSATKATRFRNGLSKEGFSIEDIDHLTCPIGAAGPVGKEPGIIAIAACSEIMQVLRSNERSNVRENKNVRTMKRDR